MKTVKSVFIGMLLMILSGGYDVVNAGTILGITDEQYFTINNEPTFLYQMSYLGITAIPTELPGTPPPPLDQYESWEGVLIAQLEYVRDRGINCLRVWTHWGHYLDDNACTVFPTPPDEHDMNHWDRILSVTDTQGRCDDAPEDVRPLYQRNMNRLRKVIEACDDLGIIVELTFARPPFEIPWAWPFPQDHVSHRMAIAAVCDKIQIWRTYGHEYKNIYFDIDNESWGWPEGITVEEISELVDIVQDESHESMDDDHYKWLCTCSYGPCHWEPAELIAGVLDSYAMAGINFGALSMNGGPGDPEKCMDKIRDVRAAMDMTFPIHVSEPFRVGNFDGYIPAESDFFRACTGVRAGGGAGWCLHTAFHSTLGNYYVTRGDLAYSCMGEDDVERGDPWGITSVVLDDLFHHFGQSEPMNPNLRRYQAEYDEQLRPDTDELTFPESSVIGSPYPQQGSYEHAPWGWEARKSDGEGIITCGPGAHATSMGWGAATLHMTWMGTEQTMGKVATVYVYDRWSGGQRELGYGKIHGDDFGPQGEYVDISIPFYCPHSGADIDVDVEVLGRMTLRLDYVQMEMPSMAPGAFGSPEAVTDSETHQKPKLLFWSTPNPFRYSTELSFKIETSGIVSLSIYDLSGREVARLLESQTMTPGTHSVSWQPGILPNGVYACKLINGESSLTTRLTYFRDR